ncbi:hypothetical protein Lal_00024077 [Lupinus albus]|nr:hypothetical protein Lal_00024077 [Lupinus albus]
MVTRDATITIIPRLCTDLAASSCSFAIESVDNDVGGVVAIGFLHDKFTGRQERAITVACYWASYVSPLCCTKAWAWHTPPIVETCDGNNISARVGVLQGILISTLKLSSEKLTILV